MEIRKKLIMRLAGCLIGGLLLAALAEAQTQTPVTTAGGTPNYLLKFDSASTAVNSAIAESGGAVTMGSFNLTSGGYIGAVGPEAAYNFWRRSLTAWPTNFAAGDVFSWYNPDGTARLWTFQNADVVKILNDGTLIVGPLFPTAVGPGSITTTGSGASLNFVRRSPLLNPWPSSPAAGDLFSWYNPDGSARLWTYGTGDVLTAQSNGELDLAGALRFPDGTFQTTATLQGIPGPAGPRGLTGPGGPQGPQGPQGTPGQPPYGECVSNSANQPVCASNCSQQTVLDGASCTTAGLSSNCTASTFPVLASRYGACCTCR